MQNQQIKVIAFDVFGTLVQIGTRRSPYRKLMRWLKETGRKPLSSDSDIIMSINGDFEYIAANFGKKIPQELLDEMNTDLEFELKNIELYEDSIETINKLKQAGYKVVVCSNTALPYGKKVSSLLPACDAYAWSYEVGVCKPDPRIYQHFIEELDCKATQVLFIGDTPHADVEGPQAIGISTRLIKRDNGQSLMEILAELLELPSTE